LKKLPAGRAGKMGSAFAPAIAADTPQAKHLHA